MRAAKAKFRRLYFPGMISLLFLPLFYILLLFRHEKFTRLYRMDVVCWSPDYEIVTHQKVVMIDTLRQYTVINIGGNALKNQRAFTLLNSKVKQLELLHDIKNGVKVIFTQGATYQDFVTVLDRGFNDTISYAPYNDAVYFVVPAKQHPAAKIQLMPCRGILYGDDLYYRPQINFTDRIGLYFKDIKASLPEIAALWPAAIPLICMFWFGLRRRIDNSKGV